MAEKEKTLEKNRKRNVRSTVILGTVGASMVLSSQQQAIVDAQSEYITVENYGLHAFRNQTSHILENTGTYSYHYKFGFTRIDRNDFEMTADAQRLGFTYDVESGELKANDIRIPYGRHEIGIVSKVDPSIKRTFVIELIQVTYDGYRFVVPHYNLLAGELGGGRDLDPTKINALVASSHESSASAHDSYVGSGNYEPADVMYVHIPVTPFGYASQTTIAGQNFEYLSYFGLAPSDNETILGSQELSITKFEQLDFNGIELEFIPTPVTVKSQYQTSFVGNTVNGQVDANGAAVNRNFYYVKINKLPNQQVSNQSVRFKITDNLGKERILSVMVTTYENSIGGYLSHADVKSIPTRPGTLNGEVVSKITMDTAKQDIATLEKNKELMTVTPVDLLAGLNWDENTLTLSKNAGVSLPVGVYKVDFSVYDNHFGTGAPNRTVKFYVEDEITKIPDQVFTEDEDFTPIPVTLKGGSNIKSVRVVSTGDNAVMSTDNVDKTITGYGLVRTSTPKTATVEVEYFNSDGSVSTTSTTFNYTVLPSDLTLTLDNQEQTKREGENFDTITINTNATNVIVNSSDLPDGVEYDEFTKTFDGIALLEGTYRIPVTVQKGRVSLTEYITLNVTPGQFVLPDREVTVQRGLPFNDIKLPITDGTTISFTNTN